MKTQEQINKSLVRKMDRNWLQQQKATGKDLIELRKEYETLLNLIG